MKFNTKTLFSFYNFLHKLNSSFLFIPFTVISIVVRGLRILNQPTSVFFISITSTPSQRLARSTGFSVTTTFSHPIIGGFKVTQVSLIITQVKIKLLAIQ